MQIDQSRARLAPRSAWQAMDLGVALWRQWWNPLLRIWLLTTLVPLVLLLVFLPAWLAGFLFWWLKPLWDRPLLEFQARALFGEEPAARTLLRQFPRYAGNGLAGLLTWRRPSPWRSFHLPVFQLEDSRGSALSQRLSVLHYPPSPRAGLLTILMLHLEQAFALAILILFYTLLPWQFNVTWTGFMVEQMDQWLGVLAWYLAMTLIEPLYVSCGFALYLNQRSRLEAWDLEPGLRRIARRRGVAAATAMMLALPMLALMPLESTAAERVDHRTEAAEILAGPDFMPMSEERTWRLRRDRADDHVPLFDRFLEWLLGREPGQPREPVRMPAFLWPLVVALMAALLAWLLWRGRHRLALVARRPSPQRHGGPESGPAGPAPVALPDNIPAAVEEALAGGDRRGALSLLYRASLERLAQRGLTFPPGATEEEFLRATEAQAGFLRELTRSWMAVAWAHRPEEETRIRRLLADWRRHFETGEAGT